jgi:hypothetical protein
MLQLFSGEKGDMKKRRLIGALLVPFIIGIVCAVYIFLAYAYKDVFPAFLWVNGVYCTGKTPEEVNDILIAQDEYSGIILMDISGESLYIRAEDIDYEHSYLQNLVRLQKTRGGIYWGKFLFRPTHVKELSFCKYDETKVDKAIDNWDVLKDTDDGGAKITLGENGYEFEPKGCIKPNMDEIKGVTYNGLLNLSKVVDLSTAKTYVGGGCYVKYTETEQEKQTGQFFEKIKELQDKSYTRDFQGSKVELSKKDISSFILTASEFDAEEFDDVTDDKGLPTAKALEDDIYIVNGELCGRYYLAGRIFEYNGFMVDDNGNPIIVVDRLLSYAEGLSDKYDTSFLIQNYLNGGSDVILYNENKKSGGVLIDAEAEFENLKALFTDSSYDKESHKDLSKVEDLKWDFASDKLGKTFIEVDMGQQHLYYYVNGELSMDMPVVTGNINRGRGTPTGFYEVYNKRYHTNLVGVDYVSYVNYWLGVNKGVGIHDATWRKKFGEEIYKKDGSHGCINCPLESVEKLWEVCEVGTPVMLHY